MFSKNDKLLLENTNLDFELNGFCKINEKQQDFVDQISGSKPIYQIQDNSINKPKSNYSFLQIFKNNNEEINNEIK